MMEYVVPAISAVVVAVIELLATRDRQAVKREHVKASARAEIRAEESRLSMQMMDAAIQLAIVSANAVSGGHNNGNVERAKEAARKASEAYQAFLQKIASKQIAKN